MNYKWSYSIILIMLFSTSFSFCQVKLVNQSSNPVVGEFSYEYLKGYYHKASLMYTIKNGKRLYVLNIFNTLACNESTKFYATRSEIQTIYNTFSKQFQNNDRGTTTFKLGDKELSLGPAFIPEDRRNLELELGDCGIEISYELFMKLFKNI